MHTIFYGHYLQITGKTREAVKETQQGLDKGVTWLFINAELAYAYYVDRQYDAAIEQANKTLRLGRGHAYALWTLAQAYEQKQMYEEALDALKKAEDSDKDWDVGRSPTGAMYCEERKDVRRETNPA
jgi:tetratricopeptide (TPR) repeat protein